MVTFECVIVSKPYANCFVGVCRYVGDIGNRALFQSKKNIGTHNGPILFDMISPETSTKRGKQYE